MARIDELAEDFVRRVTEVCDGGRLTLVVPDRTRPLPLKHLLPTILNGVLSMQKSPRRISIVVASGMHRPLQPEDYRENLGMDAWPRNSTLFVHDCRDAADLLGSTKCGIPVCAHPSVARADAVGILAAVVFHYLAGFGGGRKMLLPGVAAKRSILALHRRCLNDGPRGGRHAAAHQGILDENPLHEASLAAAALFPPKVAMHCLLGSDGSLADARVGDLANDYRIACTAYAAERSFVCDEPFDSAVVCAGSAAQGFDLVQAHKALDAVAPIVRDDGAIVLVARCPGGVGNPELEEGLALGSAEKIEAELRREFRVGWHTALALRKKTSEKRVAILSEIDETPARASGMKVLRSIDEAERWLDQNTPKGGSLFVTPYGANFYYRLASSSPEEKPGGHQR